VVLQKPIKHSVLASDGGFLETTVTGVTNLSEGSIVYGNASEIVTELNAGSEGDSLQIASGVPAWGGSSGAWASEGNHVSTTGTAYLEVSGLTDADVYQVIYSVSQDDTSTRSLTAEMNGDTGDAYNVLSRTTLPSDAGTGTATEPKWLISSASAGASNSGTFYVFKGNTNFDSNYRPNMNMIGWNIQFPSASPVLPNALTQNCGNNESISGAITSIRLVMRKENNDDTSDILGSMRVNSLSYS